MYVFWDLIHFAVGMFVFASGFLHENSLLKIDIKSIKDVFSYLYKKFVRIVVPYYVFAILMVLSLIILGKFDFEKNITFKYFFDTVFLLGGVGGNWIPRLFLAISVVSLVEHLLSKKIKWVSGFFIAICFSASLYSITRSLGFMGKFDNIFGWMLIFYIGRYFYKNNSFKQIFSVISVSGILALILYFIINYMGLKTGLFANKYPPTLYYVAYNIFASSIVFLIAKNIPEKITNNKYISVIVNFYSRYSYEMFFFHLIAMKFLTNKVTWYVDWLILVLVTSLMILIYKKAPEFMSSKIKQIRPMKLRVKMAKI